MMVKFPPKPNWYVAIAKTGASLSVRDELIAAGFDAYAPIERIARTRARKRVAVDVPMFGQYLFVEVYGGNFPDVRAIDGMRGYISSAEGPIRISDEIIEDLKTLETRGLFDFTRAKNKITLSFEPGETVRVLAGPFSGFIGQVLAKRGKRRVQVLLSLFGRANEINIESADLKKVG